MHSKTTTGTPTTKRGATMPTLPARNTSTALNATRKARKALDWYSSYRGNTKSDRERLEAVTATLTALKCEPWAFHTLARMARRHGHPQQVIADVFTDVAYYGRNGQGARYA